MALPARSRRGLRLKAEIAHRYGAGVRDDGEGTELLVDRYVRSLMADILGDA